MKTKFVKLIIGEQEDGYATEIKGWISVDGFGEDAEIVETIEATVSNTNWSMAVLDYTKADDKEINNDSKHLVSALKWQDISNNEIILEFDIDAYSKFVYVSKREEGIAISFE